MIIFFSILFLILEGVTEAGGWGGDGGSEGLCSSDVILLGITIDNQLQSKQQIDVTPRNTWRTTVRKHLLNFIPFGE